MTADIILTILTGGLDGRRSERLFTIVHRPIPVSVLTRVSVCRQLVMALNRRRLRDNGCSVHIRERRFFSAFRPAAVTR